jgi:hypothetical protein
MEPAESPVRPSETQSSKSLCLVHLFGKKRQKYSREAVELGMEIMSHGMSAQTARDTIRTFVVKLYPEHIENQDYRLPAVSLLKRWRRMLEPVCHFVALSAIDRAHIVHILSDACTKRHVGVFHVNVKIQALLPLPLHPAMCSRINTNLSLCSL